MPDFSSTDGTREPLFEKYAWWRRQVGPEVTVHQKIFDLIAGVVFAGIVVYIHLLTMPYSAAAGDYFVCYYSTLIALALFLCLLIGYPRGLVSGLVCGLFAGGAAFSLFMAVGAPFSIMTRGEWRLVSVMPFSLLMAACFIRASIRIYRNSHRKASPIHGMLVFYGFALPYLLFILAYAILFPYAEPQRALYFFYF